MIDPIWYNQHYYLILSTILVLFTTLYTIVLFREVPNTSMTRMMIMNSLTSQPWMTLWPFMRNLRPFSYPRFILKYCMLHNFLYCFFLAKYAMVNYTMVNLGGLETKLFKKKKSVKHFDWYKYYNPVIIML